MDGTLTFHLLKNNLVGYLNFMTCFTVFGVSSYQCSLPNFNHIFYVKE